MACGCGSTEEVSEGQQMWCTGCGSRKGANTTWVGSYNHQSHYKKKQLYNRGKRFRLFVISLGLHDVCCELGNIMQLFRILEFSWSGQHTTRKYFYSKNVALRFILDILGFESTTIDKIHSLKDKERAAKQIDQMNHDLTRVASLFKINELPNRKSSSQSTPV